MKFPEKIVLATGNQGKVREFASLFADYGVDVVAQKELGVSDVPETGTTFVENAIIKARHAAQVTGLPAIADDSGLVVDALGGAPGIYSARYAGEPANAENNMNKLLHALENKTNRKAQFRTAIALHLNGEKHLFEGICKGDITSSKQGKKGFGYDPIFQPEHFEQTFAEMNAESKNKISHRGIAVQKLVAFLSQL
jgi:XTP/dITP diphosphohydrolase